MDREASMPGSVSSGDVRPLQLVWLKRDLRLSDHEPMRRALEASAVDGPVALLYVHEPEMMGRPDYSAQHRGYVLETLSQMREDCDAMGASLIEYAGDPCEALGWARARWGLGRLWSHKETGHAASFERDKRVGAWCKAQGVKWVEVDQNGVRRGSALWERGFDFDARLAESSGLVVWRASAQPGWASLGRLEAVAVPEVPGADKPRRLRGGRPRAQKLLDKFCLPERLAGYPSAISAPLKAMKGCSLLSAALAHGVVSDREVIQAVNNAVQWNLPRLPMGQREGLRRGALSYSERLRWRASYLQVFEGNVDSELAPDIDVEALGLSAGHVCPPDVAIERLSAWSQGKTGVPMVDASMRMLGEIGWLNMRMRGMCASFAVGALGLDWRAAGLHLAREFLDYEPGIHWSQMQIHAGLSRLSTPLSYSPVKQARDQDPSGEFIRRWVPELAGVPLESLAEPWKMGPGEQRSSGCVLGVDYPMPIVDMEKAGKVASARVHEPRKRLAALAKAKEGGAGGLDEG